jgi:hypothetical protein
MNIFYTDNVMSGFDTAMNEQDEIAPSCKLVRTCTKTATFQLGQTCVPTSVGNVIMHNICTALGYIASGCLLLDQFIFEMIFEKYPNCFNSGVSTQDAINYVLDNINNYIQKGELLIGMNAVETFTNTANLLEEIKQRIERINLITFRLGKCVKEGNKDFDKLQQLIQMDLYGVIIVRGYDGNNIFKKLISSELQDFFPAPSFDVFVNKDPITVFQNPYANKDTFDTFMSSYLSQDIVITTFDQIRYENINIQNAGRTTWGHAMVLKSVFTYQGACYALIKNSFGEEYGLYDEGVKGLNGHIILPLDMFPVYTIFMCEPVLKRSEKERDRSGGKKTRRRPRKTMRKRRPNKKTHAIRKKRTRK